MYTLSARMLILSETLFATNDPASQGTNKLSFSAKSEAPSLHPTASRPTRFTRVVAESSGYGKLRSPVEVLESAASTTPPLYWNAAMVVCVTIKEQR